MQGIEVPCANPDGRKGAHTIALLAYRLKS
jgi:hypothetical protein